MMRGPAATQAKKQINKSTFCILEFEQVSSIFVCFLLKMKTKTTKLQMR